MLAVWLSDNCVAHINEVALRRGGLVLGWVTFACTILVFNQAVQAYSAWPPHRGYSAMSTGDGLGHYKGRNGEFCVTVGHVIPGLLAYWPSRLKALADLRRMLA